ncbi:MAG: thioredoxin family protein [Armatimonadetes bacterium]|nr:thioredoxin family protein [Armatimonadota bacterium]
MLAAYLVGLPEALRTVGRLRRLFGFATLAACVSLLSGLNGRKLDLIDPFLPPEPYPSKSGRVEASAGAIHAATYEEALLKARDGGKTVFVDFTGVTCANCRYMEKNVFPVPEVAAALRGLVQVQLYTDRPTNADRANQKLQGKLAGNQALPTYVLVRPDGSVIDKFEGATRDPREFAAFLRKAAK